MPETRELPPLPAYECGGCGHEFGSNCALDDIACPECDAKWCPGCGIWFGGNAGEPEDTPEGLAHALERADLAEAQLAVAKAALHRLSCAEELAATGDPCAEHEARCTHAAGALATIARLADRPGGAS